MKIGVYGGTFNPPHLGHITAARAVFDLLQLDRLLLIPAGLPPHKEMPAGSPTPQQRLEMTRLAGEQTGLSSKVEILDMELVRTGKSYTSDTLAALKEMYPDDELWLLMGTDMFLTLQAWHAPEEILRLAGIAAFGRTEEDSEELFSVQREYLTKTYPGCRIFTLTIPGVVDVSSTEIRAALAKGAGAELLAPAVYGYILRHGLYGTSADLKKLPLEQLRPVALSYLKHKRIPHVLGTEQEAIRLAERYGADVEKARVAALLHDCTKRLSMEEQLSRGPLDLPFLMLVLMLVGIGLIMVFSASFASAMYSRDAGYDPTYYIKRQTFFAAVGLALMYIISKINYQTLRYLSIPLLIVTVILLVLVLTPLGVRINGAQRWLYMGLVAGPTFQPSEVAKIAVILFFASRLSKRDSQKKKKFTKRTFTGRTLNFLEKIGFLELVPYGLVLGLVLILVVFEPAFNLSQNQGLFQ